MSNDIKEEEEDKFREDREKKFLRQTNTEFDVHLESFRESFSSENSWNALRRRSDTRLRSFYWIFLKLKKKQAKNLNSSCMIIEIFLHFIRIAITIAQCRKMYMQRVFPFAAFACGEIVFIPHVSWGLLSWVVQRSWLRKLIEAQAESPEAQFQLFDKQVVLSIYFD